MPLGEKKIFSQNSNFLNLDNFVVGFLEMKCY